PISQALSCEGAGKAAGGGAKQQFDGLNATYKALNDPAMPPEILEVMRDEGLRGIRIPAGKSKEFATLLRNYDDRYPDVAERNEIADYSLRGLLKSYETWSGKAKGGGIVDF
ncbi:MAG: hypothetical protein WC263_05465, partial [Candidatus Micrarchaeia archaeon]